MIRFFTYPFRLLFVAFIGITLWLNRDKPSYIRRTLESLGPSFIKLGQLLSSRPDVIGERLSEELSRLQDRLPPFSFAVAKHTIETQCGTSIESLFSSFEPRPVAAASIAQVHKAVTKDGRAVAVKVLRPQVEKVLERDIRFFYWLAYWLECFFPHIRRLRPVAIVALLQETIKLELDLRFEAAAAAELKENTQNDPMVYVPDIDWKRTAQRVLTLEWVDGIPILQRDQIAAAGHDFNHLTEALAVTFFNQAFRDGFFHADMHPGNLFVDGKGRIVPVDFGIMGRLSKKDRLSVAYILKGFMERDYESVAKVHIAAGYVPKHIPVALFAQACRSIGEPVVGLPLKDISVASLLAQLFKITKDFSMETQPQLLLLQKSMLLIEGVGGSLDPEINMWKVAEPWIKKWAASHMGVASRLGEKLQGFAEFLESLPNLTLLFSLLPDIVTERGVHTVPLLPPPAMSKRIIFVVVALSAVLGSITTLLWLYL